MRGSAFLHLRFSIQIISGIGQLGLRLVIVSVLLQKSILPPAISRPPILKTSFAAFNFFVLFHSPRRYPLEYCQQVVGAFRPHYI
jgi:hypothetical protein